MIAVHTGMLIVVAVAALILLVWLAFIGRFIKLWVQAYFANAPVGMVDLIGMALRKVDPRVIVLSRIRAVQAGLEVTTRDMEIHCLAGGRVPDVVTALIAARRANIDLTWKTATTIDLAGRDVVHAVEQAGTAQPLDCPDPASGQDAIIATAGDGVELRAKIRLMVRRKPEALIVGGGEETLLGRASQGVISAVAAYETWQDAVASAEDIARELAAAGLDEGIACELASVEIVEMRKAGL